MKKLGFIKKDAACSRLCSVKNGLSLPFDVQYIDDTKIVQDIDELPKIV